MKKMLAAAIMSILILALTTTAFADKPIRLLVNGAVIQTDVPPQMVSGRVLIPARWVTEALGADVRWDEQTKSVLINTPQLDSLERQVSLLLAAAAPSTPGEAVEKWARGVKERNGALQYAVLAPELKEQSINTYKSCGWVTGTSSPWVDRYQIAGENQTPDGWEYQVKFETMTSTGPAGAFIERVVVKPYKEAAALPAREDGNKWYIAQIINEDSLRGELRQQAEDFITKKYGRHYRVLEKEITPLTYNISGSRAEAEFSTRVTCAPDCTTPAQWPPQQGRIKFLSENRNNLSAEQINKIQEQINFWEQELRLYMSEPGEVNEFLKFTAEFDGMGMLKKETVKIYYEDPNGNYQPVLEEEWPAFKTAEELISQGYEEMRRLAGHSS